MNPIKTFKILDKIILGSMGMKSWILTLKWSHYFVDPKDNRKLWQAFNVFCIGY